MDERRTDLRSQIAEALAGSQMTEPSGSHLDADRLIAYHEGHLEADEADRAQDHLVACDECREEFLELDRFVAAPQCATPTSADLQTAAAWRDLRSHLDAQPRLSWQTLAAVLAAVSLGLGLWSAQRQWTLSALRREMAALSSPQPGVPIVALSAGPQRSATTPVLDHETGVGFFAVSLIAPSSLELASFDRFQASILDATGEPVWKGELGLDSEGWSFTIGLSRRFLRDSEYTIVLYGISGGEQQQIGSYSLHLGARP